MASFLSVDNFELKDWQANKEYKRTLMVRNDGSSSLKFIYYINGSNFKTKYTGVCFLAAGLHFKIDVIFQSQEKHDICEKLVIKTISGINKEVELKASIKNKQIEILEQEIMIGRVLCFEEQLLSFKLFNIKPEQVQCNLTLNGVKKEFKIEPGLNDIVFTNRVLTPGLFAQDLQVQCVDDAYSIKISGFAELPQLRYKLIDSPSPSPTMENNFYLEVENISFKKYEFEYTVTSKTCDLKIKKKQIVRPNTPVVLCIPYRPKYFNFDCSLEFSFQFGTYRILKAEFPLQSLSAYISCVSEKLSFTLNTDKDKFATDFLILRNNSNFPVKIEFFCDLEEIDVGPEIQIEKKEFRKIPVVFSPKYPGFFSTSIAIIVQGSDPIFIKCDCHAKSSTFFNTDLMEAARLVPNTVQINSVYSGSNLVLSIRNNTLQDLLFKVPTLLNYNAFSIQTAESTQTLNSNTDCIVSFQIEALLPFYQYVFLHFMLNGKIFFFPLLVYSANKVISLVDTSFLSSPHGKCLWNRQNTLMQSGVSLNVIIFPKCLNHQSSRLMFMFDCEKIQLIKRHHKESRIHIHYDKERESVNLKNISTDTITFEIHFETKNLDNFSVFPKTNIITLLSLQEFQYKVLFVQKKAQIHEITIYLNGLSSQSFQFSNPICYRKGLANYGNIEASHCIHHLQNNILKLNQSYLNQKIRISVPFEATGQVSYSLDLSQNVLNTQYFEDFSFSEDQEKVKKIINDGDCYLTLDKSDNNYLIHFDLVVKQLGTFNFKSTVCIKRELFVESFDVEYKIIVQNELENENLMQKLCYKLQCPPEGPESLRMVNYFSNVIEYFILKDDGFGISSNFKVLWLGLCSCGTEISVPLILENNSNCAIELQLNTIDMKINKKNITMQPNQREVLFLTFTTQILPSLFCFSVELSSSTSTKTIFVGGLGASWLDTNKLSYLKMTNTLLPDIVSHHFEDLSESFISELLSVLYTTPSSPKHIKEWKSTDLVPNQLHFHKLSDNVLQDILNFK